MTSQARTKDGKFAKKEEYNPDHDPATKGYVKCLLRKTRDHTHEQTANGDWCVLGAGMCWFYVIMSWFLSVVTMGKFVLGMEHAFGFMTALTLSIVALEFIDTGSSNTGSPDPSEPKCIREYTPPSCSERYNMDVAMREWNEARKKRKCE